MKGKTKPTISFEQNEKHCKKTIFKSRVGYILTKNAISFILDGKKYVGQIKTRQKSFEIYDVYNLATYESIMSEIDSSLLIVHKEEQEYLSIVFLNIRIITDFVWKMHEQLVIPNKMSFSDGEKQKYASYLGQWHLTSYKTTHTNICEVFIFKAYRNEKQNYNCIFRCLLLCKIEIQGTYECVLFQLSPDDDEREIQFETKHKNAVKKYVFENYKSLDLFKNLEHFLGE